MKKALLGIPLSVAFIVFMIALGLPKCATCGGHDEAVTEVIKHCPRALEYLGADPKPVSMGIACGSTEMGGGVGHAGWHLAWAGDKKRGTVEFAATESDDKWSVQMARLDMDGETLDLVACANGTTRGVKPPPGAQLAQTNADAAGATFSGRVITSNNAAVPVGGECTGSFERSRGSRSAHIEVTCRADTTQAEGQLIYDGNARFTLDVRDATTRDDDHLELEDATSVPGVRMSASAGTGTLTVFSNDWEVIVAL